MLQRLNEARKAGKFCDLTILCNGHELRVHKVVVCTQSAVIEAACDSKFKESSGVFEMKEVSVDIVRRMIEFMYTGDYSENLAEPAEDEQSISPFSIHVGVFALADMYLVGELRALSVTKYGIALKSSSDYTGFLQSVDDMYNLTPHTARELREKAIAFTRDVLPRYLNQPIEPLTDSEKESLKASPVGKYPSPAHRVLFEDLLAAVPEFARDLVISFIQEPLRGKCNENCTGKGVMVPVVARDYRCKKCNGGVTRSIYQS